MKERVAVLGLGLMGGSLVRELAAAGHPPAGWDADPAAVASALEAGALADAPDLDADGFANITLVVLAVPVRAAPELLRRVAALLPAAAVVTDLGSTKRSILRAADDAGLADRFVGSHPMAGDHRTGWGASRTGLFRGARVWLCPADRTPTEIVERVSSLWRAVGGEPRTIDAPGHDRLVAWTSHLPQAVASALAGAIADRGIERASLGPGGRDATRLAASDPRIWSDILLDNADEVLPAVDATLGQLEVLRDALKREDGTGLAMWLREGHDWSGSA